MALVAGHTLHTDASTTNELWKEVPNAITTHPADTDYVKTWGDVGDAVDMTWGVDADSTTEAPTYRTGVFNGNSALLFDAAGTPDRMALYNDAWSSTKALSDIVAAGAGTIWVSFRLTSAPTYAAKDYTAHTVIADTGGYCGIHVYDNSGTYKAFGHIYAGGDKYTAGVTVALDTNYVAMLKWDGSNLNFVINDGTPDTVAAAANIDSLAGAVYVGKTARTITGYIGEVATYSTALSAGDEDTNWAYFLGKWVTAGFTISPTAGEIRVVGGTPSLTGPPTNVPGSRLLTLGVG